MGFYKQRILPDLVHLSMRNRCLVPFRARVVSAAEGRVLEIGIGSGLNLPFYGPRVLEILGLDPSPRLIEMARRKAQATAKPVAFIEASAEEIPLETGQYRQFRHRLDALHDPAARAGGSRRCGRC